MHKRFTVVNQWVIREFDFNLPYMSTRKEVQVKRCHRAFEFRIRRSLRYIPLSHRPLPVRSFLPYDDGDPMTVFWGANI